MFFRSFLSRIAQIFTAALVLTVFPLSLLAQTSAAGAMKINGNFFVLKPICGGVGVIEWKESESAWQSVGLISGASICSEPRGLTSSGGFHTVCSYPGGQLRLLHWEPNTSVADLGSPGTGTQMSAPSDVMYGSRVFVVGQAGANNGSLFERFDSINAAWFKFESPTTSPLRASPPSVLRDGSLFVSNMLGDVWQMWWNASNNTWNWYNHGHPPNSLFSPSIQVLSIGAAMPVGTKVFATCNDGTLRQIYHNGTSWIWYNHGNPFGYNVDAPAAAIAEGKLFVTGNSGGYRVLLQLYWNGSSWVWYNHGWPTGTTLLPGVTTTRGARQVVVKATNGNFYETYWSGSAWEWKNLGTPIYLLPLEVLVHAQDRGDMTGSQGEWVGTKGNSLRLEGFAISFTPAVPGLGLQYMAHLANIGDTPFVEAGQFVGTRGESRRLEGFAARLTGPNAVCYDLFYQCHLANLGDSALFSGPSFCGTRGESRRVEALRVWIVAK